MRSLFCAALDRFVGDEPGIATASQIAAPCMRPARNIAFVLIWNSKREPINFNVTGFCEMENIFVAIVEESLRANGFEMSIGANVAITIFNRNRFDPVNCVLQNEEIAQFHHDFMRQHWVRRRRPDVQKK